MLEIASRNKNTSLEAVPVLIKHHFHTWMCSTHMALLVNDVVQRLPPCALGG